MLPLHSRARAMIRPSHDRRVAVWAGAGLTFGRSAPKLERAHCPLSTSRLAPIVRLVLAICITQIKLVDRLYYLISVLLFFCESKKKKAGAIDH